MFEIFKEYKSSISQYIQHYLSKQRSRFQGLNRWVEDSTQRIEPFANSGKQIRGGLAILSAQMYGKTLEQSLPLGAAMEFFQSAFLIHDDIMDMDEYRRGEKSLYYQYQEFSQENKISQHLRSGQALGICLGDIVFFWAYDLLNHLECEDDTRQKVIATASSEYAKVGLAQMEDVYFGFYPGEVSEEEILNVFRYKTARYTFSLPFMLGALFAGADPSEVKILSDLGEHMGIIFQIKDDELGIFGESDKIGKPAGSDIAEDKKTLFRHYLVQASNEQEKEKLKALFGSENLEKEQLKYIQTQIVEKGVDRRVDKIIMDLDKKARQELDSLSVDKKYKEIILELMQYSLERKY